MKPRIQRLIIQFRQNEVRIRAQARSARGTPYTVASLKAPHEVAGPTGTKRALSYGIGALLDPSE